MSSSCTHLWRIVEQGFHLVEPNNLTPREDINSQLNATALHTIQSAATDEYLPHIQMCKTAKDAWQKLDNLFLGNKSIQQSKYETTLDQAEEFVMQDDESPEDLYQRLTTLAVTLTEYGDKQVDDAWIKRDRKSVV